MKKIDYTFISSSKLDEFKSRVNELIAQGWELHGTTSMVVWNENGQLLYGQAMIKQNKRTPVVGGILPR